MADNSERLKVLTYKLYGCFHDCQEALYIKKKRIRNMYVNEHVIGIYSTTMNPLFNHFFLIRLIENYLSLFYMLLNLLRSQNNTSVDYNQNLFSKKRITTINLEKVYLDILFGILCVEQNVHNYFAVKCCIVVFCRSFFPLKAKI